MRHSVQPTDWKLVESPLLPVYICSDSTIDESDCMLHIVNCKEYLGECSSATMSYDEMVFYMRPECMCSMLICPRLRPCEAVLIIGTEKISLHSGVGSNVRYVHKYDDTTPYGYNADSTSAILQRVLICIDPSPSSGTSQYTSNFDKDIDKAYAGLSALEFSEPGLKVATGIWSSGTFGSNNELKFLQQYMSASLAGKCLVYHPSTKEFELKLEEFMTWIEDQELTVGALYTAYKYVIGRCNTGPHARLSELDIFECIMDLSQ